MTTDDMKCDGVAKLKFSEVRKMFRERQVEMDEPGVWLMADCDGSTATYDADGLEGQLRSILFPMAAQALGELIAIFFATFSTFVTFSPEIIKAANLPYGG